jgi:hypothetical protein
MKFCNVTKLSDLLTIDAQKEIEESKRWLEVEKDDSTYKRDLQKRIELIN